jgi:hypothetical protein
VYRARDARLDRSVAIKILPAAFSADTERLRRFEPLNHPNIITIYELGQDGTPGHSLRLCPDDGQTRRNGITSRLPILRIQTRQPISNFPTSPPLKGACWASTEKSKVCQRACRQPLNFCGYSAVVGSITDRIREIRLAGKPPCWACLRTASLSGATYMQ